jgi:hypothetical protein
MDFIENICLVCNTKNELDAVVCWKCGAELADPYLDPGATTKTTDPLAKEHHATEDVRTDHAAVPASGIAVYVAGVRTPAYIDTKGEFVIGRKVEKTSDLPETMLDLSPLGGYGLGISRRHAVIRRVEQGYEVVDLGSVNGSWLNNERLVPHKSYPLASGAQLRLGSMRLFVLYRSSSEAK